MVKILLLLLAITIWSGVAKRLNPYQHRINKRMVSAQWAPTAAITPIRPIKPPRQGPAYEIVPQQTYCSNCGYNYGADYGVGVGADYGVGVGGYGGYGVGNIDYTY